MHLKGKPTYLAPQAEFVYGDVRDANVLLYALKDIDAVYHLAAYQDYLPDFSTYFDVNAVSTARIYELIVEHRAAGAEGHRRLVAGGAGRGSLRVRGTRTDHSRHPRRSAAGARRMGAPLRHLSAAR